MKALALFVHSEIPGERNAARRAVRRLLARYHDLNLADAIVPAPEIPEPKRRPRDALAAIMARWPDLSVWEQGFAASVSLQPTRSPKQQSKLAEIAQALAKRPPTGGRS